MFKKKDRWVKTDKEGHKHYGMKMDTGYINASGKDINLEKKEQEPEGEKLQFNYVQKLIFPMKRIKMKVPGFKKFGLKIVQVTDEETKEVMFAVHGFTFFGMTRCAVPRAAQKRMEVGRKYRITIQNP